MIENKIDFKKMQEIELDILKKFDKICSENNLRYSLSYGTLIGAVRHEGFIPWDDDVDVIMPREDYEKLVSINDAVFKDGDLKFLDFRLEQGYVNSIGKIINNKTVLKENINEDWCGTLGVYIDIFPVDTVPQNNNEYKSFIRKCAIIESIRALKCIKLEKIKCNSAIKKCIYKMIKFFLRFFDINRVLKMQLNTITKYRETEINENTMVRNLVTPETMDLKIPLHSFDKLIEMKFEDAKFKVIPNYDEYLRKSYGDYMQLPPEEERIPGHGVTTYWK